MNLHAQARTHMHVSCRRLKGVSIGDGPTNWEINFDFVTCSCRAREEAGEAKLRGRVRGVPPHRWALGLKVSVLFWSDLGILCANIRVGCKPLE